MERTRKLFARAASAFVAAAMALSFGAIAFAEEAPAAPEESAPQQTAQAATPGEAPAELQAAAPARLAAPAPKAEDLITVVAPDGTESGYNTLDAAAKAAPDGSTIRLNGDVHMANYYEDGVRIYPKMVIEGKTLVLDGQGHTVTAADESFSMIEVEKTGTITIKNITLEGNAAENRQYSNIINVEGGKAYIEDNTTLKNNCTAAVSIGTNVEGGVVTMNGGLITGNVSAYSGRSDTGVAVTVLEGSTFIMNGGTISDNKTLDKCTSAPAIMANRGGVVVINGGTIENNSAAGNKGGAIHIQGGDVTINGGTIRSNNAEGYGSIYVTNHSSFERKWDGVLTINGGTISDDGNAIYLWSKGNIADTGAYVRFSGSPTVQGRLYAVANGFENLDFKPIEVTGAFAPTQPVTLHSGYDYVVGQTMVQYADGMEADSAQFIALYDEYGYQKNAEKNLLYTEQRREVVYMDGAEPIEGIGGWTFVEETLAEPAYEKAGYTLEGWYKDEALTQAWDFAADKLPREVGTFYLYGKWSPTPAAAPTLPANDEVALPCGQTGAVELQAANTEEEGHTYAYEWKNAAGEVAGTQRTLTVPVPETGESETYTLTVTATRTDNGEMAQAEGAVTVTRAAHTPDTVWTYDENGHWHECTVCGAQLYEAQAHNFAWVIDREAAVGAAGEKHEECTVCGYRKPAVEIPALPQTGGTNPPVVVTPVTPPAATPQTGDESNAALWAALLAAGALGLAGTVAAGAAHKRRAR